ncbi:hypothetical protein BDN72DRAFT_843807 [Pluteus cervinus]|uniref:Uncharacterized protein n=1 Tax=Pluteus cervinus TaxID=181527 RepID=A0ACD3ALJ5_9AGAR|nr:hypothetical protein BDN72DRAFT_843807 [Pluteus cervinus]
MLWESIEQAQAKIDAEILQLEARIYALRSSRNALTPAYRLPTEVLSDIFGLVQLLWTQDGLEYIPKWTTVTHVSRHWRNIALECGTLWSDILLGCTSYAEEAIKRSGGAHITLLDVYSGLPWDEKIKPLVLSVSPRLHKLVLSTIASRALLPELADCISQSLHELVLVNWDWATEKLFPKSLRSLKLHRSFVHWNWLQLPHLTELSINISGTDSRTSVTSFTKLLNQMPLLTGLLLEDVFDETTYTGLVQDEPDNIVSTSHPRLRSISLRGTISTITQLLSQIQLTEDFTLRIVAQGLAEDPITEFVQCLNKHLHSLRRFIRSIDISCTGSRSLRIGGMSAWASGNLFLAIELEASGSVQYHWMKATQALSFDELQTITGNAFHQYSHWEDSIFKSLKHLALVLFTDGPSSSSFLEYLAKEAHTAEGRGSWVQPFFQPLNTLSVVEVQFTREMEVVLKAVLEEKMRRGFKLTCLILARCWVSDGAIEQFQTVVSRVERGATMETLQF